jgi:hypothetical protein
VDWILDGNETVTFNNGDFQSGGESIDNLMVIPKTNTQSSLLTVENMGWSGANTVFSLIVNCPTELPSFVGTSDSTLCNDVNDETFYFARFNGENNTYPERNNPIFSDPNGENGVSLGSGNVLNISMANGKVIQVENGMVIDVSDCTP